MTTPTSRNHSAATPDSQSTRPPAAAAPARKPSPPWYGGVSVGLLFVIAVIVLTYTLLDWDWQQSLGGWNYVVSVALIPVVAALMRGYTPDDSTETGVTMGQVDRKTS